MDLGHDGRIGEGRGVPQRPILGDVLEEPPHGLQCGFCTPGFILTTADLLSRNGAPSDAEIRHALRGNLCRCTGYQGIVESIRAAGAAA